MRIDGAISVSDKDDDRLYTSDQVIAAFEGAATRTTIDATYQTTSTSPTVYYTGLDTAGAVITARTTSGVTLNGAGLYVYHQPLGGRSAIVAVWDEGNANDYVSEMIVA